MGHVKRRQFMRVTTLALLTGCGVVPSLSKPATTRVPRIGVLEAADSVIAQDHLTGLKQGLADLDYVENKNIVFDVRDADNQGAWQELADELVRVPVDVLFAIGSPAAIAARYATTRIPIVFTGVSDPVEQGLVASLAYPGRNLTGVTFVPATVEGKNLELLARLVPGLRRVAVVAAFDPGNAAASTVKVQATTSVADALGIQLKTLAVHAADDVEPALTDGSAWSAEAMFVLTSAGAVLEATPRLVDYQQQHHVPVVFDSAPVGKTRGGLMTYTVNNVELGRSAASLVNKILKGSRPGELPVQQPTAYEFVVNQTVANALGITISADVAQEVTQWDR
jgi:putative ABC transport system substrate-binding protein